MGRIKRKDSAQRGRPAAPDHWTGRPGGSGAKPPLHLIYIAKIELMPRRVLSAFLHQAKNGIFDYGIENLAINLIPFLWLASYATNFFIHTLRTT